MPHIATTISAAYWTGQTRKRTTSPFETAAEPERAAETAAR